MKVALIGVLLLFFTIAAPAQTTSSLPLITVSGEAAVNVTPDEIVFRLKVENEGKDLIAAMKLNDERVKGVMALAPKYQIDQQYISADALSVESTYDVDFEDVDKKGISAKYEVSKTIFIVLKLKDLSRFDSLLSEATKLGAKRVSEVSFRTSQIRKYEDQARTLAIKAAREKALAMAQEIGQTIGKAHSIQEEGPVNSQAGRSYTNAISGSDSHSESSIAPGQISVTARVIVSFELK